jgi:hypothetical protein
MLDNNSSSDKAQTFPLINPVLKILWVAMLFAIPFLGLVVMLAPNSAAGDESMAEPFYMIAVVLAIGSVLIRNMLLSADKVVAFLSKPYSLEDMAKDPKTMIVDSLRYERLKALPKDQLLLMRINNYYTLPYIISFCLSEAVGMVGFVFVNFSGSPANFIPFGIVAAVCLVLAYPRPKFTFAEIKSRLPYSSLM